MEANPFWQIVRFASVDFHLCGQIGILFLKCFAGILTAKGRRVE
jgi:hypothetical protein